MLHIFTLGTKKTLCGKTGFPDFDAIRENKQPDCMLCQVREDAMLMRGWKKEKYRINYTRTQYHAQPVKSNKYPSSIRGAYKFLVAEFWQKEDLKAAIKMAKLGAEDFG